MESLLPLRRGLTAARPLAWPELLAHVSERAKLCLVPVLSRNRTTVIQGIEELNGTRGRDDTSDGRRSPGRPPSHSADRAVAGLDVPGAGRAVGSSGARLFLRLAGSQGPVQADSP